MILSVPAFVITFVIVLVIAWVWRLPKNLPPGPSITSLLFGGGSGQIYERFANLAQKYGPIFSIRLGGYVVVVLGDGRLMRQALVDNATIMSDHFVPGMVKFSIKKNLKNGSIGFNNGKIWTDLTRFCMPVLRSLGFGKRSLEPSIAMEAKCLCEEVSKHNGTPVSFEKISNKATANVICQLVFGKRFEFDDAVLCDALDAMATIVRIGTPDEPSFLFPIMLITQVFKKGRQAIQFLDDFTVGHIRERKKTFDKDNMNDLIDAYLADEDFSKEYVPEEFGRTILDFFAGGTETTATFLMWTVLFMAAYPDIQRKVHHELDNVIGCERQPALADRSSLPYCDATVMEILRLRPSLPLAVPHVPSKDLTLGGFNVPKGAIVIPCLWAAHHNPKDWEDPEAFKPERFLEEDGVTIKKHSSYFPYGLGRRECLGAQLAKMETFIFFTTILQTFELKFPPNQRHSLKGRAGLTVWPEPHQVCAVPR